MSSSSSVVRHPSTSTPAEPETNTAIRTFGAWLTTAEACAFLNLKSVKGTFEWIKRHGIIRRGDKRIARFDLERELKRMARAPRTRRGRHPHSLANLRKRAVA